MKTIYEEIGGTYRRVGDYLIPDLALDPDAEREIGKYGRMHMRFLEEHHPGIYASMLLSGKLWQHLAEIDNACNERMERLVPAMARQEGVTEALKAANQMEWVGRMNNIRNRAEEIIFSELVYAV